MSRPELHFAHANGIPSACYRKLHDRLADRYVIKMVPVIGTDPAYPVEPTCTRITDQVADSIRAQCSGPVVGVGHSLGALTTFMAAHRFPELFSSVVLLDPPIIDGVASAIFGLLKKVGRQDVMTPVRKSKHRRERWPSREDARASLADKPLFRAFDPACFDDYIAHGLVSDADGVRLTIPVATEVAIFRVTPHGFGAFRGALRVPGTVVLGSSSEFARRRSTERFARRYGLAHVKIVGGHMFPLEHPLETAALVERAAPAKSG